MRQRKSIPTDKSSKVQGHVFLSKSNTLMTVFCNQYMYRFYAIFTNFLNPTI